MLLGFTAMLVYRMHAASRLVTCESKLLHLPAGGSLTKNWKWWPQYRHLRARPSRLEGQLPLPYRL